MKRRRFLKLTGALGVSVAAALAACAAPTPIPPTATPKASPTPAAPTAPPTLTVAPTDVPSATPAPTSTPAPTATPAPTEAPTKAPTPPEAPDWKKLVVSTDIKERQKGVDIWVEGVTFDGYFKKDGTTIDQESIDEIKKALKKYLPYVHTSPLTVFSWYTLDKFPFPFPENPLEYLQYVRTINNSDGKGTHNGAGQSVWLDRTMYEGETDDPKAVWVGAVLKEAMLNAIYSVGLQEAKNLEGMNKKDSRIKQYLQFYADPILGHFNDMGTVAAKIAAIKDITNAKGADGEKLFSTSDKTTRYVDEIVAQVNDEAKKQKWR